MMKLFWPIIRISLFLFISLFQEIFCQIPGEAGDCERVLHLSCQRSGSQLWSEGLWCLSWWAPEVRCVKPQVLEEQGSICVAQHWTSSGPSIKCSMVHGGLANQSTCFMELEKVFGGAALCHRLCSKFLWTEYLDAAKGQQGSG